MHTAYRTLRTFLYWWEDEYEPSGWKNPIRKVKPPKLSVGQLELTSLNDIQAMLGTCDKTFCGLRDKAILLVLLDTGARAQEFLNLKLNDYEQISGEILIRLGKGGGKSRTVFLGKTTRKAVRAYLITVQIIMMLCGYLLVGNSLLILDYVK